MRDEIGTLLVLGADGDLARRLLLPGLGRLLAGDWEPRRSPRLLGAGLGELSGDAWQRRVREAFASASARGPPGLRHRPPQPLPHRGRDVGRRPAHAPRGV